MKNYIAKLAEMPLFADIQEKDILPMLKCLQAKVNSFGKDDFIRNEGDAADFIGIVLDGTIHILHYDMNGNRNITASFSSGDMFAEAISCAEIPSLPFSIQAVTDCQILFLKEQQLLHPCHENCDFHSRLVQNLIRIISRKNMLLNQKLRYLSHKTTAEKLLDFLNDQAKRHYSNEFTIPFDRQALADYLGVERSALSAEISKLKKQGILDTRRSWFRLL